MLIFAYIIKDNTMTKDTHITQVVFRKFKDGEIIALMPHEVCDHKGSVTSYMHIGQHGGADYNHIISTTKLATPTEALPLYQELESIGYNLVVVKKRNYNTYLKSYYKARA
jgi:hypothetical protein